MQYNVHLFIGAEFAQAIENVGIKLLRSGGEVLEHANIYMANNSLSGFPSVSKLNLHDQTLREKVNYIQSTHIGWTDITSGESNDWSSLFETKIYREILGGRSVMQGALPVFIHFPFYKKESLELLDTLCKGIIQRNLPVDITFFGYGDDMAAVINPNLDVKKQSALNVSAFEKLRGMEGLSKYHNRLIFIQDSNVQGIPLGISNLETFADLLEQLMILFPAYMDKIYPMEPRDVTGLGFASLNFDKYKFSKYLLQKGIMQTIDNSSINEKSVDINDVFARINKLFANRDKFLSAFIDENKKIPTDDDTQNKLFKTLKSNIELLQKDIEKILSVEKNVPFKAALLAALLSKTEYELFSNSVYNQSNHCYLDLYGESIDYFIVNDEVEFYQINGEKIVNPIEKIKDVNKKLINGEEQIRTLEKRLKASESYIENSGKAEKCLKDNGVFQFDDYKFRLLPNIVEELKLEPYEPKPVTVSSVDLRPYFSSVKNQGSQGSCTSHTIVAIFEFMMKVNQAEDCDLSEAFLFYNARKIGNILNTENTGSSIQDSLDSLVQYGIALEKFCPYNPDIYDIEPSMEAYEDASTRKLIKARVVGNSSEEIRSALAEGYPVAGSFKLTENFTRDPYVEMPSEEEISKSYEELDSSHAMVIVGFNDELQMFLVRNSWGTSFGINGYCYIPYEYVNHPKLFNCAFIMTEVASLKSAIPDLKDISALKIDSTDSKIRHIVNKAALNIEKRLVEKLKEEKVYLQEYIETIRTSLASANNRDDYVAKNKAKLNSDKVELEKKVAAYEQKQDELKNEFKASQKKTFKTSAVAIILLTLLWILINIILDTVVNNSIDTDVSLSYWYCALFSGVAFLWAVILIYLKKRAWIEGRDLIENKIKKAKKDIQAINLKLETLGIYSFAAWLIIRTLEDINEHFLSLYIKMISLINNLREWYKEIKGNNSTMQLDNNPLEISLLDKDILNSFFDSEMCSSQEFNVDLTEDLCKYEITPEYLSTFKMAMIENIRKRLERTLHDRGFNISAHISSHEFDKMAKPITSDMVNSLNLHAGIFMRLNLLERGYAATTSIALAPSLDKYENIIRSKLINCAFSDLFEIENPNKIILVTSCSYDYNECVMLKN